MSFITTTLDQQMIVPEDYIDAAVYLGVEPAVIHAVDEVESGGSGFLPDGKIKVLFEGHIFHRYTKGKYSKDPAFADISYPAWTTKYYAKGTIQARGDKELERLSRAATLDRTAALMSASYGRFQVMGFNFAMCGYTDVSAFFDGMQEDETKHLEAFIEYCEHVGLVRHLKTKDWAAFAKGYNGPLYTKNAYDTKLAKAYAKWAAAGE